MTGKQTLPAPGPLGIVRSLEVCIRSVSENVEQ
jgi:hypothetical protein